MTYENDAETLIKYLIGQKLMTMNFDRFLNEQTVEITPFGEAVNDILNHLKTNSKVAQNTNEFAAEKLDEEENQPK